MNRKLIFFFLFVIDIPILAYFGIGYVLYDRLSNVAGSCDRHAVNQPDNFADNVGWWGDFDFSPYQMDEYRQVRFPSREAGIEIAAYYIERQPDGPTVIVVHGLGSCKRDHAVLTPAGMLARANFNVLVVDVRDVGESTFEDGRSAIGNAEYRDVLGAWDWLVNEQNIPPAQIGLLGNSLGAATTLIAFDQEPRVAAIFVDSPFADLRQIIREELDRNNYPRFLTPSGLIMARIVAGDNLTAHDPANAIRTAGERPIFILHGTADQRIGVHHSEQLAAIAAETGANATVWIIEGAEHVRAAATHTDEYEAQLIAFFQEALTAETGR
jgi:dipeptidyl aminopeptidase/acylaminoacyl peptidase